ncbi:MAG: metal ABC transporter permease [Candidatus Rifleibacteriota bacterium]
MFDFASISAVIELYGQALPTAILMAITFSIFGVFVVLKRIVFIGITLSEVAACGVAAALIYDAPPFFGASVLCLMVVGLLAYPYESSRLPRDTVLGSIFILASGMSILIVARSGFGLEKVKALLYGNLLFASNNDLTLMAAVMIPALLTVFIFFRPLLYTFLDRESAQTLGIRVIRFELMFFVFLGLIVASSSKIAGVMLVFCYLVIPAAAALLLSRRMTPVLILSAAISVLATWLGIMTSYSADLPPNQLVAVISCAFLFIAMVFHTIDRFYGKISATVIALALSAILITYLNSLEIKVLVESTEKISQREVTRQDSEAEISGWPGQVKALKQILESNRRTGLQEAVSLLKSSPPEFFAEEIVALIEESIEKKLELNRALPLHHETNLKILQNEIDLEK